MSAVPDRSEIGPYLGGLRGGSGRVLQLRITRKTPQTATAMATESWGRRRVPKTSTESDFESLHRRTLVVLRARPLVNVRASWWGCEDSLNPTIPTRTRGTWLRDHARASAWGCGNTRTHRSGIHTSSRWLHRPGACAFWSGYEGSPIRRKPSRNRGTFSSLMSSEYLFDRSIRPSDFRHLGATRTRRPDAALAARYTRWVAGR